MFKFISLPMLILFIYFSGKTCTLKNTTIVPEFFKDAQTDWLHYTGSENPTTIGPSAMFKSALDAWKVDKGTKMVCGVHIS